MLIIAVVVSVTIGITKAKLDNIVSYTYYNAYSTLRKISTEMLADWDPQDPEYKLAFSSKNINVAIFSNRTLNKIKKDLINQFIAFVNFDYGAANAKNGQLEDCRIDIGGTTPYECSIRGGDWCPFNCKLPNSGTCVTRGCCGLVCKDECNKTCDTGFTLDKSSCSCECTRTCSSGYRLNSDTCSCEPSYECWDGSYATSESNCPRSVTCWDGNKKHDWSECPPCTNKPNPLPCGQGWDEHICQLTGTAKTCPSGQHLNSGCDCIVDCPSNLTACQKCDNETGVISQNPDVNRSCSEQMYEWSEEQCKCIPSPRTLPRKGENFCKLFERHANIMSGSEVCSGSVISNGTTNFADKSPDITLRNGLRVYNMHTDARAISDLANNTQGGSYDGVPNTNSYGYTVYVDIDGSRGDSQLWSDVYPFYITLSGKIIPAYDTSNPEQSGGDSVRHMQVSVENENYNSGRRSIKWLAKSVPFKEGACIAGYVGDSTPYCKNGTSYTQAVECTSNINSFCRVKQIQPVKFFF